MSKTKSAKKASARKNPTKQVAAVKRQGQSKYELAAEKAIALNPNSAAYSAAIAVIEVLLKEANAIKSPPELIAFLNSALAQAKDGTGQDGGEVAADVTDPGKRAK